MRRKSKVKSIFHPKLKFHRIKIKAEGLLIITRIWLSQLFFGLSYQELQIEKEKKEEASKFATEFNLVWSNYFNHKSFNQFLLSNVDKLHYIANFCVLDLTQLLNRSFAYLFNFFSLILNSAKYSIDFDFTADDFVLKFAELALNDYNFDFDAEFLNYHYHIAFEEEKTVVPLDHFILRVEMSVFFFLDLF
jgi:hypothetical protein